MVETVKDLLQRWCPVLLYLIYYYKGYCRQRKQWVDVEPPFRELVAGHLGKKCLQIGARKEKYSSNFVCVDLYDSSDYVDFHYDIHKLGFDEGTFDLVVCNAVLEHVADPVCAISELRRVLKKGGMIWIEVPFNQPYHPCPHDYWRVTLHGLELWMKDFRKIRSGVFGTIIYNGVFFHGVRD